MSKQTRQRRRDKTLEIAAIYTINGGKTMAKKKGKMTVSEAGHKGGSTTARKYGREFYVKIGRKGGQRVKELIEKGKKTSGE